MPRMDTAIPLNVARWVIIAGASTVLALAAFPGVWADPPQAQPAPSEPPTAEPPPRLKAPRFQEMMLLPRARSRGLTCKAQTAGPASSEDPCAVARRIATLAPCLDPKDCLAYDSWSRFYGQPRIEGAGAPEKTTEHTLQGETRPPATIADVAWMEGHWHGEALGGTVEEIWSPPLGDSVMGAFRLIKDGAVVFYEILSVVEKDGSLELRLKHFNTDLTGWEEKDEVVEFPLVKITDQAAYFNGLTYLRHGEELRSYVTSRRKDGRLSELEFILKRVGKNEAP